MRLLRVVGPVALLAATWVVACSNSSAAGSACKAAGGTCMYSSTSECITQGPSSTQDCNAFVTPNGQECCLLSYGSQTCAQRTTEAQEATVAAENQAEADLSCASDSDCVVASNSSTCWLSCGVLLNQAGATQLASTIAQINATTCAGFTADSCEPNPAPPCVGLLPFCVAGQCKDFLGGPDEDAGTDAGVVPCGGPPPCPAGDGFNPVTCACFSADASVDGAVDASDAAGE